MISDSVSLMNWRTDYGRAGLQQWMDGWMDGRIDEAVAATQCRSLSCLALHNDKPLLTIVRCRPGRLN